MRKRGILFSSAMVRALLAGTKTQTRRALSPLPPETTHQVSTWHHPDPRPHFFAWTDNGEGGAELADRGWCKPCPYGAPGDRLWVREAWRTEGQFDHLPPRDLDPTMRATSIQYEAGPHANVLDGKLRPGMFMPRWASRITLEVIEVRVERLQDISEAEAQAEGADIASPMGGLPGASYVLDYRAIWEEINGPGSWDANPWVWCVSFRRLAHE